MITGGVILTVCLTSKFALKNFFNKKGFAFSVAFDLTLFSTGISYYLVKINIPVLFECFNPYF